MTYAELLEAKQHIEMLEHDLRVYNDNVYADEYVTLEDLVSAIECMEKQILKRPDRSKNYGFCKCPEGHNIPKVCESGRMRYCPFCGQALEWGDEE